MSPVRISLFFPSFCYWKGMEQRVKRLSYLDEQTKIQERAIEKSSQSLPLLHFGTSSVDTKGSATSTPERHQQSCHQLLSSSPQSRINTPRSPQSLAHYERMCLAASQSRPLSLGSLSHQLDCAIDAIGKHEYEGSNEESQSGSAPPQLKESARKRII